MNRAAQQAIWEFGPRRLAEELRKDPDDKDLSDQAVYAWLDGKSSPRPPKARRIVQIVPEVSMEDLMAPHEPLDVGDRRRIPKHTLETDAQAST